MKSERIGWKLVAFAALTIAATYWGKDLSIFAKPGPPTFWPAAGVYLAFIFTTAPKHWWKVALVNLVSVWVANALTGIPLSPQMWLVKSGAMFAGAALVAKLRRDNEESVFRDAAMWLAVTGGVIPAVGAALTCFVQPPNSFENDYWSMFRFHFAGGSLGILTVTPFVMLVIERLEQRDVRIKWRALAIDVVCVAAMIAATLVVFDESARGSPWHSPYFLFALLVGIYFRGRPLLTAVTNLSASLIVIILTLDHRGLALPFHNLADTMAALQTFVATITLTGMLLTAAIHGREVAMKALGAKGDELRRLNAELAVAKERALAASHAKSAFLANISHEIRSPLGAMIGFADLIAADGYEGAGEYATVIKRNGMHLTELINQVLDLSKVEAGRFDVAKEPTDLRAVVDDVRRLMELKSAEKRLHLDVAVSARVPRIAITDGLRLKQILINAVGNAIKFTAEGRVTLRLDAQQLDDKWRLKFEIEDTGIGLAPEEQPLLFQKFSQANGSIARQYGGTGLGLSLSRHLARLLGGDFVLVSSQKDVGSTFAFWIDGGPSNVTIVDPARAAKVASAAPEIRGLRVLLADDAPDNRLLVQRILEIAGATVASVGDGRRAVERATSGEFDLILMDVEMPEMDGLEAVTLLRVQGYKKPIVALTGRAMASEIEECRRRGFDAHLVKPIDRALLLQCVGGYAARVNRADGARSERAGAAARPANT